MWCLLLDWKERQGKEGEEGKELEELEVRVLKDSKGIVMDIEEICSNTAKKANLLNLIPLAHLLEFVQS